MRLFTVFCPFSHPFDVGGVALYDFVAPDKEKLSLKEGDALTVIESEAKEWLFVQNDSGSQGWVPTNYVKIISSDAAVALANVRASLRAKDPALLEVLEYPAIRYVHEGPVQLLAARKNGATSTHGQKAYLFLMSDALITANKGTRTIDFFCLGLTFWL